MEPIPEFLGYSTQEALRRLRADIAELLREYELAHSSRFRFLRDIISISSEKVLLSGVAYSITFLYMVCLVLAYIVGGSVQADVCLLLEALLLFTILVANFLLAVHEDVLRRREIPDRIRHVLSSLDEAAAKSVWGEHNYPHLCAPFSPCVTLQWTYRDGMIVNLPWALLVRGDVVVLRPGQDEPGRCVPLHSHSPDADAVQPATQQTPSEERFGAPRTRVPHQNKAYRMLETPYLGNLRLALQYSQDRPVTVYNKQRYLVTVKLMEGVVLPLVIALVVVASVVRHIYALPGVTQWTEMYFLQTIAATLPLLQIVFPLAWVTLNCYGMARFKLLSETKHKFIRHKSCSISEDASDPLLEALSESNLKADSLKRLAATSFNILVGRENMVTRTSNIVHVLGSLSALCCVDKKGILSWPNPTAEKVFFLRNTSPASPSSSRTSLGESQVSEPAGKQPPPHVAPATVAPATVAEVLDLTHDQNAPFCVEFDDRAWREHLARLKPLGLAALLNTCAPAPRHTYSHLCAHLTCEARLDEDLVPVPNRRCLCELAKQIGFEDHVTNLYSIKESLAVFRHLQPDTIRRETRFARSLHLSTRVKVPLPHMLATIVRDPVGQLQLLSQGTADIVLDSCADYWDGADLVPLSPSDRKKVLDFYQRSSLTAYCTAFAYKPLNRGIEHSLAATYLELPADCRRLYPAHSEQWSDHRTPLTSHFHSSDSLLFNGTREDDVTDAAGFFDLQANQVFIGMVTMQYQAQSDMVELVERLERACVRFVHFSKENELRSRVFSEKMGLESGWNCHISLMSEQPASKPASPEPSQNLPPGQEARPQAHACNSSSKLVSNAASHRDGYGTGTARFHYSNMESTKTLSMSTPGAINLEHTTVKFDSETKRARHSIPAQDDDKLVHGMEESLPSADSLLEGGGVGGGDGDDEGEGDSPVDACRSLSCLTDSTDHSAPLNFDMSNRAKLPRGIENIRPHIEQVDNVPLLVSLFTDCTATSARRMISIMQDYSEVVCVIGSAANRDNMHIFMQADASIAVEPLYPVLCQKLPPYEIPAGCVGPIDLARALNAVPCSIANTRDSDISLFSLITMSRHFMNSLWNATQFWMCSVCSLSLLQVGSLLGFLPLCLSVGGALWSSVLVVPALSAALTFVSLDPLVMQRAATHTRHNTNVDTQVVVFVLWCYGCKFVPSVGAVLALYGATLRSFCEQAAAATGGACTLVYPVAAAATNVTGGGGGGGGGGSGWGDDFYEGYYLAQHIALILVTVHLIVISMSFVDRNASIWQKFFWSNKVWSVTAVLVLVLQCMFSGSMLSREHGRCERTAPAAGVAGVEEVAGVAEVAGAACGRGLGYRVPWSLLAGYVLSPLLVFCLNEFIKWQEIKANIRYQRRARLDFGTKLGMNSPF